MRATGSLGMGLGSMVSVSLTIRRMRPPMSTSVTLTAGPVSPEKTRRAGSALPPMPRGWTSRPGPSLRDRGADLEHVGAEVYGRGGIEVVGVVLEEGDAAQP